MMEDKRVHVHVEDVYYVKHPNPGCDYYVLLRDDNSRRMPIYIGEDEVTTNVLAVKGVFWPVRLVPDAILACITALGGTVERIDISALGEDAYTALVALRDGERITEVEMRPSNAIPLALRAGSPIYVPEEIVARAFQYYNKCVEAWEEMGLETAAFTVAASQD